MATLLVIPASAMTGAAATTTQMVSGDAAATFEVHQGRLALAFDGVDEEAAVTAEMEMPSQYTGSGLTATLHIASETVNSSSCVFDVFVEAKTPGSDTLDMEAASSWNTTVNTATHTFAGTAGDPRSVDVTLTNSDGLAAGDLVRFGVRRDTDSGSDDIVSDIFVYSLTIEDDG